MNPEVYRRLAELEEGHWWFVARRRILEGVLARLPLPEAPRILEVGCGTGGNLAMLARLGEVVAVEPTALARSLAAEKGDFDIRPGRLPDDLPFAAASFDLVVALDVLEHVEDDEGSLRAIARLLRPGGFAIFTVPAFPFLWSGHDRAHHHKRRYRKVELRHKVGQADLAPRLVSYFNFWLFPVIAAVRLIKKLGGVDSADDARMPSSIVNRILAGIFASERHLLGRLPLPFGASLLLVGARPER